MIYSILVSSFVSIQTAEFSGSFVTSSDSTVVTGIAHEGAVPQSFMVRVEELATNERISIPISGVDDVVTTRTSSFIIHVRGQIYAIPVWAGITMRKLAEFINENKLGVTATVFDTGSGTKLPARFVITDNRTGKFHADRINGEEFNLRVDSLSTNLNSENFREITRFEGRDARIEISTSSGSIGRTIVRSQNMISDAVPGVTLFLMSTSEWRDIEMTVSPKAKWSCQAED